MKKTFRLTAEFVAITEEKFTGGNIHERAFWQEFLKDDQAIDDFYCWYYLEVFRECPGFERIAEKLIKREDREIFNDIIQRLPKESAAYMENLIQRDGELIAYIWEQFTLKIEQQFKAPVVIDAHLQSVGANQTLSELEDE